MRGGRLGTVAATPWWQWALALGVMGMLSLAGLGHYHEFTTRSRRHGCISNQGSIDKMIAVWESRNQALPVDRELWLDLSSRGRILRVSPQLAAFQEERGIAPANRLRPGSDVLYTLCRDEIVFICPTRWILLSMQLGDETRKHHGLDVEMHYRWMSSTAPRAELDRGKRGAMCLLYGQVGPRYEPEDRHLLSGR